MENVGEILKSKREALGYTVDEVVAKTKIQKIYIDAIENSNFSFFVGQDFYQQVFVGNYSNFLGFNKNEILEKLSLDRAAFASGNNVPKPRVVKTGNSFIDKQVASRQDNTVVQEDIVMPEPISEIPAIQNEVAKSNEEEIDNLLAEIDGAMNIEAPVVENPEIELTQPVLDNLIFEQIEKIEQEAKGNPTNEAVVNSGVIDIVGGLDIETQAIPVEEPVQSPVIEEEIVLEEAGVMDTAGEPTLAQRMAIFEQTEEKIEEPSFIDQAKANSIENTTADGKLFINDNNDRTAIDIRVGRALGDKEEKVEKTNRFGRVVEIILVIAIIIIFAIIAWQAYNMFK